MDLANKLDLSPFKAWSASQFILSLKFGTFEIFDLKNEKQSVFSAQSQMTGRAVEKIEIALRNFPQPFYCKQLEINILQQNPFGWNEVFHKKTLTYKLSKCYKIWLKGLRKSDQGVYLWI